MEYDELPVVNEPMGDTGANPNNLNKLIKYVPTLDDDVKSTLRNYDQPITIYGEDKPARRERLINLILTNAEIRRKFIIDRSIPLDDTEFDREMSVSGYADEDDEDEGDDDDEEFYTPGPEELIPIRSEIADFSLAKAKKRINEQQMFFQNFNETENLINRRNKIKSLQNFQLFISQIVSDRCTSILRFSKHSENSNLIAAGSWNGQTYIMNQEKLNCKYILVNGHEEKIGGVDWNPTEPTRIATSGNEGNIALFDINNTEHGADSESEDPIEINPSLIMKGHTNRVTRLDHHPCGKYLASASFDTTWRYWDLTTAKELFFQEGHSKEVFTIRHHPDGSLIASGGLDAITRIWDIRIGKSIAVFQDHIKGVYAMDWRSNGHNLITGSGDNSIKVWDLRKSENSICTIGGHKKLVSDIKISTDDKFFVSSGYDGLVNIYSCDNWLKLKSFTNNEKQMTCDVSLNDNTIISGGWDRSLKLYTIN
ncbi:hypothetical protein BVG19_g4588 [[Candida] boidinii]|nr:hypothetical protein BVG19_g4588 [[Candida] boidinii]OWB51644.1 hypothetical protein B5S27_g3209 [[Candida] boidinii]